MLVCKGLENPQLEKEWEWLRETRDFRPVHPWGGEGCIVLAKMQVACKTGIFSGPNLDCFCVTARADGTLVAALSKCYYSTWLETRFSHNIYNSMSYSHDKNIPNILPGPQLYVTGSRTQPNHTLFKLEGRKSTVCAVLWGFALTVRGKNPHRQVVSMLWLMGWLLSGFVRYIPSLPGCNGTKVASFHMRITKRSMNMSNGSAWFAKYFRECREWTWRSREVCLQSIKTNTYSLKTHEAYSALFPAQHMSFPQWPITFV